MIPADYADALKTYYQTGPAARWNETHISAYATAHPLEDWAETWGHYLHILTRWKLLNLTI